MMSHELRTPLNQVLGITQLLELTEDDDQRRDQLGLARRRGTDLLAMIDDMLLFTALREGKGRGLDAECSLDHLLACVERHREHARDKGINFEVEGGSDVVVVDLFLVQRAVVHLVDNAVKYTDQGTVRTRAHADGERLVIEVLDDGSGIPAGKLQTILSLFRQDQDGMARSRSGMGLGLSMCQAVAEALGGRLELTGREGGGTCAGWFCPRPGPSTLPSIPDLRCSRDSDAASAA